MYIRTIQRMLLLFAALSAANQANAQPVLLGEQVKEGEHFRYELALTVEGRLKTERNGKTEAINMSATAAHNFIERIEHTEQSGGAGKVIRHYATASSTSKVGPENHKRELAADRRMIVAVRTTDGTLHFSPTGPLTRDELGLVGEHFDTLSITTLLPGKEVETGATWKVSDDAAQHVCLFEGLLKNELQGTLTGVKDGIATFTITGTAEGVEMGATARVVIKATGKFDLAVKKLTELDWEQADDRSQGAVSPASDMKARVILKRTAVAEEPKELSAEARAAVPADKIPAAMTQLRYNDPDGKYSFNHSRDWHVIGRTVDHLILRLLDKNQFVAQATITGWKKADAGKHTPADEFKGMVTKLDSWEAEGIITEGEQPAAEGSWLYAIAMKGKQDGAAVVQIFYLLAGPTGDQLAISMLTSADNVKKLAGKDADLIKAIQFPPRK